MRKDHKTQDTVSFVLDSGSMLAYLWAAPGGQVVHRVLKQCRDCRTRVAMSTVDLLAVYQETIEKNPGKLEDVVCLMEQLPLSFYPLTPEDALSAAQLLRDHPWLKPAQAVQAALARSLQTTLVTSDKNVCSVTRCLYINQGHQDCPAPPSSPGQ